MGYAHYAFHGDINENDKRKIFTKILTNNDKMLMLNHYLLLPYLPLKSKESKESKRGRDPQKRSKVS